MSTSVNPPGHSDEFVRPPLCYPGNKAELAADIIEYMPAHETYVEPFCGTAGVLFQKERSRNEVLNDVNTDLTTFMRVLRDRPDDLVTWLEQTPYAEAEYNRVKTAWRQGKRPDDDVVHAGHLFLLRRASFGADLGGFRAEARGRKNSARQFVNARDRLYDLSERLNGVIIRNTDWRDIIDSYAGPDTFFYLDPPYRGKAQYYGCEYDPFLFENYWLTHFDGSPNATEQSHYPGDGPPAFLKQRPYQDADEDYRYGGPNDPLSVMISSDGPIEALNPFTWSVKLPYTHELNNHTGEPTEVQETLTMNYDPYSDDFQQFTSHQQTLTDY